MGKVKVTTEKKIFNTGIALLASLSNCVLLAIFIWGYGNTNYATWHLAYPLIIPFQLGIITIFTSASNKRIFKIFTIVSFVFCLIFYALRAMLIEYAKGFIH